MLQRFKGSFASPETLAPGVPRIKVQAVSSFFMHILLPLTSMPLYFLSILSATFLTFLTFIILFFCHLVKMDILRNKESPRQPPPDWAKLKGNGG